MDRKRHWMDNRAPNLHEIMSRKELWKLFAVMHPAKCYPKNVDRERLPVWIQDKWIEWDNQKRQLMRDVINE